jgi:hypothetical protein
MDKPATCSPAYALAHALDPDSDLFAKADELARAAERAGVVLTRSKDSVGDEG